ncbi:hypothetical protein NC653_007565 [Populus alba x Populus x berolinensis]|uniref:Response regulatory domain-containing protein n=1 Tax=Populus alba x Populus x berolinensis TaxID=444605 RepID=A0AAD6RHL7_9ROSI|nr:hypothetical protein NC653_007565 [Populus alba x Populus x berolinensis]
MIPVRRSEDRCRSGIPVLQLRNRISALLVDSDRSSQIAQSSFLRLYGVDTQTASNGLSAFVLASASSSTSDLIVIDISLPVMDGLGVAIKPRENKTSKGCQRKQMATSINSSWKLGTKMTALVVDDDSINQTIHHRLLEQLGIENQVARNGKEAIDIHCSGKKFDLILMDRDMPVMNGIEATRKLRAMGIRSMIAGVSTRCVKQEIQEFMEAGLDDYQEKPLTSAKIISILHKIDHSGSISY